MIGHVGPEAAVGGPIGLIEDGDTITVDLNHNTINCQNLEDAAVMTARKAAWDAAVAANNGNHPSVGEADTRLLNRMRCSAVSAIYGAGMHPNRELWVNEPRRPEPAAFTPQNKFRAKAAE